MARRVVGEAATKVVAIKLVAGEVADDPRYRKMFVEEARIALLLSHSNVVQVFDVALSERDSYLVMEWVDGLNLAQILHLLRERGERVRYQISAYIVGQLLHALSYAHTLTHEGIALGIVHRDVSPQNVLVSVSGEVKLTDFGVAKLAREDTSGLHIKGKLRYMAPEQLSGQTLASIDIYAAGAVLHELLDGRRFRDGLDEAQLVAQIVSGSVPKLSVSDVPSALDAVRTSLLAPDPARRVANADEALTMLSRWPGYRNAAAELGKLCRGLLGVQAPRSGIYSVQSPPEPQPRATPGASGASLAETRTTPTPVSTTMQVRVEPIVADATPEMIASEMSTRPFMGGRAAAIMHRYTPQWLVQSSIVGAAAVVSGAGLLLSSGHDTHETTTDSIAQLEPEIPQTNEMSLESPEIVPTPSREPPLRAEAQQVGPATPSKELPLRTEAAEQGGPADPGASSRVLSSTPRQNEHHGERMGSSAQSLEPTVGAGKTIGEQGSRKLTKATVQFRLGGLRFAYIRVDGARVVGLEPLANVELTPGRHRLEWRVLDKDPWKTGGEIRIEAGRTYRVRVTADGPKLEASQ